MPVTLNNTNITINDGTNNFVLETVKTHVPEFDIDIDIIPAITYPDTTTRNLQLAAETATGVNGWRIVRFLPLSLGRWYTGNYLTTTNMEVTDSIGTAYDYTNEFMVPFGTYDEIWFGTYDMTYWVYTYKSSVLGNYSDSPRNVISSSENPNPHTIEWYNRTGASIYDPVITHINYGDSGFHRLYIEDESTSAIPQNGGMCVFVRSSTDTISRSIIPAMPVYEAQTTVTQYPVLPADATNLVAHYKFDGDFTDSSENGNDLIPSNVSTPTLNSQGIIGNAMRFVDGVNTNTITNGVRNGTLKIPTIDLVNSEFSISFWFKQVNTLNPSGIFVLGENERVDINGSIEFYTKVNELKYIYRPTSSIAVGGFIFGDTFPAPQQDKFYHIVLSVSSTDLKIYVDNNLRVTETSALPDGIWDTNYLGCFQNSTYVNTSSDFILDDFRIYDKVLTAYEIDILANNKIENPDYNILTFEYQGPSYPVIDADAASLVAWYKFDSGEELTDSVGNSVLTIYNGTSDYQNGKINESLNITDSGYKITSTTLVNLFEDVSSYWSVSFWYDKSTSTIPNKSPFISRYDNGGVSPRGGFEISINTNGTFLMERLLTSGAWITATTTYQAVQNQWVNIVYTCQPNLIRIYVDGILNVEETTNLSYASTSASHNELIGFGLRLRSNIVADYTSGHGYLEDFRIYNKALSATEISDLYNQYNQTEYTVNFPEETECDILIVGGGGGGGSGIHGGGGGAGGLVFQQNLVLNGSNTVKVGKGGNETNGFDSSINDIIAIGGGLGGNRVDSTPGLSGGSGGGGSGTGPTGSTGFGLGTPGQGNDGGNGYHYSGQGAEGGGGGGAGFAGNSAEISSNAGYKTGEKGGDGLAEKNGIDFKNHFAITDTNIGEHHTDGKVYFAGGGGGSGGQAGSTVGERGEGGLGGGGFKTSNPPSGARGALNNSGGGGGQADSGGSGIVIIRYNTKYIRQHPAYDAQWTYHSANPNVHNYGNVGIGTLASETNKLTVKGDINVIGDIYENNNKIAYGWNVSGNSVYNQYGNVGIGTNDPRYALHTTGVIYAGQGGITETGSTTWTITSDNRIKENIEKASYDICSENIKNINLYRFNYNTKYVKTTDKNQLGFIAQDVRKYFPKAVKNKTTRFDNDVVPNLLSVDVTQLNYTMYGAVKHIGQDIDAIKEKLGITEVPNDVKNQPYFTEVVPFNDPDAELPIVNEEPATN